jgi:hypothetical protein
VDFAKCSVLAIVLAAGLAVPADASISSNVALAETSDMNPTELGGFTLFTQLSTSLISDTVWFNAYIGNTLIATTSYPITSLPDTFGATVTPADSNFAALAALLTNGIDNSIEDFIGLGFNYGSTCCGPTSTESRGFFPSGGGPDFKGDTITSIDVTWYGVSGTLNGSTGQVAYDETLAIFGTTAVPEPAGLIPAGVSLFALTLLSIRRRVR